MARRDQTRARRLPPFSALGSWAALALVSYLPLFASRPGLVAADTKAYLYLDPGRLTQSAASMWDPSVGMGTVTHQNIGYLFPMGPYFWAVHALGLPMWVGQRFWMGSLLFAAGTGVWWCSRLLGLTGPGRLVAAVAYTATPFIIDYIARISAILMPWAALGWMLGLVILAVRRGGWRGPALFALVVALVGGVNATSILLVGLAPALWVLYAVWVTRETTWGSAWAALWRTALLSLGVSLWWAAGLWAEGSFGLAILQYTETVQTVARTSLASEVLRGLGYWFFYGQDKVQPWTTAAVPYMQDLWLIAASFAIPFLSMAAGLVARWRYRAYAVGLILVGVVASVGTYPYNTPSPLGQALETASNASSIGLAMRSSNRVAPLVVLGLALLLGSGLSAAVRLIPRAGWAVAALVAALVVAAMPPLWQGELVATNLARPSAIPSYWTQAAAYLDAQGDSTRVLGLPGEDFAAYSWGITQDPILPGLMTRPYVSRQVVPQGEPASVDLMAALDGSIQNGVFDPQGLAAMARLISAGDVLVQNDLQYERYSLPQPKALWPSFDPAPAGTELAATFGAPDPARTIKFPLVDETSLALPNGTPDPPALAVLSVPGARPISRTESAEHPLLVAGNGQGLVYAADAGLLTGNPTVLYSATFDQNPAAFNRVMSEHPVLVVTDTNAVQGHRWGGLQDNFGYVQQPGETPLVKDPSDAPLPVFPGQSSDAQTTADQVGVKSVRATHYGNPVTFTPEDRAANAFDGNLATAWTVAAFSKAVGEGIEAQLESPVTTDHIVLVQPVLGHPNRHITEVKLTFDHRSSVTAKLGPSSLSSPGQTISFGTRTFSTLQVTIEGTSRESTPNHSLDGLAGVGFSEIGIPGVNLHEVLDMPGDLLRMAGTSSLADPLVVLMDRDRAPDVPPRTDPELDMARSFQLPTARTFTIGGQARISAKDADALIESDIGAPASGHPAGGDPILVANSSTRLPGDRNAGATAAVDSNPSTAWSAALTTQAGEWLDYQLARPLRLDHLDLQVVADGRHSIPTRITLTAGGRSETVTLPIIDPGRGRPQGATTAVPVRFPALTGSDVRITIDAVHQLTTLDYYGGQSGDRDILPVALAEVGLPGAGIAAPPAQIPATCHSDLLTVDGHPVDIRISGTTQAALAGSPLTITPCGNSAGGLHLGPGPHQVQTSPRFPSGFEVDQLSLTSAAGGGALPGATALPEVQTGAAPALTVTAQSRTTESATVRGQGQGFWLVLGQSLSRGWHASVRPAAGGKSVDLGSPTLIDGYANGWYVPAADAVGTLTVTMAWTPQEVVWVALAASGLALTGCLALALWPRRRRRPDEESAAESAKESAEETGAQRETTAAPAPRRASLLTYGGSPPGWAACLIWAVGAGLLAGLVSNPLAAPAGFGLVLAGLRLRPTRPLMGWAAPAVMAACAAYMVTEQAGHGFLSNIDWPGQFPVANTLGWAAVLLLAGDALVEAVRQRGVDQPE